MGSTKGLVTILGLLSANPSKSMEMPAPLKDNMTLSFHHHFRNGDRLLLQVLATAEKLGIKGLTIAASSIFPFMSSFWLMCKTALLPA